ncbi:MAG: hypothetical protein QGI11_09520 [Nitrospinota bacterium]|nr:hypothetical protein [Nitrospinota bacterium]
MGDHENPHLPLRHRLSGFGVEHLDDVVVLRPDKPGLRHRLAREGGSNLAEAKVVVGVNTERPLDAGARCRVLGSSFAAKTTDLELLGVYSTLAELLADVETDELLGMHILGSQASHLIAEGVLALEYGASAEDVARTVHAHPALSEVVKEAAWAVSEQYPG